jgi:hypothetical protein
MESLKVDTNTPDTAHDGSTYHSIESNIHFIIIMVHEFMCAFVTLSMSIQQSSHSSSLPCFHSIQASAFGIANRLLFINQSQPPAAITIEAATYR